MVIQVTQEVVLEVVIQVDLGIIVDIMEAMVLDLAVLVVLDLVEEMVAQEQVALGLEGLLFTAKFVISDDILRKLVLRQCNATIAT